MEIYQVLLIVLVSFGASWLTFYTGFGLGTLLLPVFSIWFPIEKAIGMTAIVHLLNNLFKIALVKKNIDFLTLLRFGIPSIIGAILGSLFLHFIDTRLEMSPVKIWKETSVINQLIGVLVIFFGMLEFFELGKKKWALQSMTIGGLLSGFFGGLSGHQGALRSAFLLKYDLSKEVFIATGIAIACLVDVVRITVYIPKFFKYDLQQSFAILLVAILAAITGAFLGNKFLQKINIRWIKTMAGIGIITIGLLLLVGIL